MLLESYLGERTYYNFEDDALSHLDKLTRLALKLTRNYADAHDLVQDTYERALGHSHQFTPGTNMKSWLFRIMYSRFYSWLDDAERQLRYEALWQKCVPESVDSCASRVDAYIDVKKGLSNIPAKFRAAISLYYIENLPQDEIMRILNCPVGTVKSRIFRGKEHLRAFLE